MELLDPSFPRFARLAKAYNRVPLVATLIADEITPVSAFARLQAAAERAFLLESVTGGERVARYSFLGAEPALTFEARPAGPADASTRGPAAPPIIEIREHRTAAGGGHARRPLAAADPLLVVEEHLRAYRAATLPGLPRFGGGVVGYAGYDLVRYYENLPAAPPDDRRLPDLVFDLYDRIVIFDHVQKIVRIVVQAAIPPDAGAAELRRAYERAAEQVAELEARLRTPPALHVARIGLPAAALARYESNFPRAAFEGTVAKCQEYIRAGDIFQVVLSQRLAAVTAAAPLDIYRALRVVSPAPFMFCLKSPAVHLVGASPEILCRVEQGRVISRPLAGTRPRGRTEAEDRRLGAELLADPKERAEHVMLVDLGRNDVGRVSRPGSVQLSDALSLEYYSHVMHISSTVTGELAPGRTAFDALRATLPVGTVSGAPKVRAMQIIDECEPTRRGPYGGAVGYVDFHGNMDMCIALRTLVIQPEQEAYRVHAQVGAGIVADSEPAREYQETLNKAHGLLAAIRLAEERLRTPRAGDTGPA